jgi:uncharacterized protein YerC
VAQVSRRPLQKEVDEQIFGLLVKVLTDSFSKEEAGQLIDDLLTPTEKIVLAKRLAIALLLAKKYSYGEIREILKVSQQTIALVNVSLRYRGGGYRNFVSRLLREQKVAKTWQKLEDLILNATTLGRGKGTGFWRGIKKNVLDQRRRESTPLTR